MKQFALRHRSTGRIVPSTVSADSREPLLRYLELEGNGPLREKVHALIYNEGYVLCEVEVTYPDQDL